MKRFVLAGAIAGAVWGPVSMAVNSATGIFAFENGFGHDLAFFISGGVLLGAVSGGALGIFGRFLSFKNILTKAVFVCLAVWLVLKAGGTILSKMEPDRFHIVNPEAIQGFCLSIILGALLGLIIRQQEKRIEAD